MWVNWRATDVSCWRKVKMGWTSRREKKCDLERRKLSKEESVSGGKGINIDLGI